MDFTSTWANTWPYLTAIVTAAGLDIVANIFLAKSDGFKKLAYGISAVVLVALAFTCLAYAVRGMDLAVAYAMWGALGILGTSLGGWLLFSHKIKPAGWLGIAVLVGGITLMHFG